MNFQKIVDYICVLSLYINIEKSIRINNIRSPKMLTLRFFFPSIYKLIYIDFYLLINIFFFIIMMKILNVLFYFISEWPTFQL
jgi:hypothetical protein